MIKIKDGKSYSLDYYSDYKFRCIIEYYRESNFPETNSIQVYTDNSDKEGVFEIFKNSIKNNVKDSLNGKSKMVHWVTKEQDDRTSQLIEDTLKNI